VDLDDYELGERIGVGSVGTIFEATHKTTGSIVAVKFLSAGVSSEQVVSRFAREMMILEKLSHPNILEYYGGGKQDGQLFFVMELICGGTLKDLLTNTGPLTWKEAAEVSRQIAGALQHAHNHGIIHRDLKPGNVFITKEGVLKLGDFGIARDQHEQGLTDVGLTVGTYSYMPPELVRGEKELTGQVDLYALGCVMFELVTGRPPYLGDNFAQIFEQHLNAEPPRPSELGFSCPHKYEDLIVELMAKSPEDRPFNARSVQGYLGELLDAKTDDALPQPDDTAASELRTAKAMLSERVGRGTSPLARREVSWRTLSAVAALTVVAVLLGVLLGRRM